MIRRDQLIDSLIDPEAIDLSEKQGDTSQTSSFFEMSQDSDGVKPAFAEDKGGNVSSDPEVKSPKEDYNFVARPKTLRMVKSTLSSREGLVKGKRFRPASTPRGRRLTQEVRTGDPWTYKSGISDHLPPIHDITDIFDDMTRNAVRLGLRGPLGHLADYKLKVATMCSGTESPLLALQLISDSLKKQFGLKLEIEHQFSAEIVPYKQAYIERNFSPPVIFRDIREMFGSTEATTAYGAMARIPAHIDLLVAGFSCVDFSNLNVNKQTLDSGGESGDTFRAVYNYAKTWRPALIVLENVCSAPWERIKKEWEAIDYDAGFVKLDTKHYYIPHTRQRGYMLCVDRKKLKSDGQVTQHWMNLMALFRRPASSSIEAFMLHEDDPRVHRGRAELVKGSRGDENGPREVDWTKCQGRHQDYRADLCLGSKRPLTGWEDNGSCTMPDYAWGDWGIQQVERIWDTFEISFLRNARRGFDSQYKTRVWELSQNIDRFLDTTPFGITSCITPTGSPYVTNRGGPMIGLEALSMQGLPIEKLLLTRESQKQLQDLAGNAMTSTVVGAAMMGALIVGYEAIQSVVSQTMALDDFEHVNCRMAGEDQLPVRALDLDRVKNVPVSSILSDALHSCRLCLCEGRALMTSNKLRRCKLCGHTTCEQCGGTPSHQYEALAGGETKSRISPLVFENRLKNALPMRLFVMGLDMDVVASQEEVSGVAVQPEDWEMLKSAIGPALGVELRFHSLKRAHSWTVYYDSPTSRMELILTPHQAEWRAFAKPRVSLPANSPTRELLAHPFARMRPIDSNMVKGRWQFCFPAVHKFKVKIQGIGILQRAWESRLGLQEPDFADKRVWSQLRITMDKFALSWLDMDISGVYDTLPDCGKASGSLHKQRSSDATTPMFLFLDPDRLGNPVEDQFVFSRDIHRLDYGESRPITATLDPSWRPSDRSTPEDIDCSVKGHWVDCSTTSFEMAGSNVAATFAALSANLAENFLQKSCDVATTILSCKVPLPEEEAIGWKKGGWIQVDRLNESTVFRSFAWLTERVRRIEGLESWKTMPLPANTSHCPLCAPKPPQVRWKIQSGKLTPYEDPEQAAPYEHSLKNRPSPFITQVRIDENNVGILRIGLNVWSLVHRALFNLSTICVPEDASVSWRLSTDYVIPPKVSLPKLRLLNNKTDLSSDQPPNFLVDLRPEQLRSLYWMRQQEVHPVPFFEEEIEEALLPQLYWRAEAAAKRKNLVRGGVLADQVGYGKTATTLGLIDLQSREQRQELSEYRYGKIMTNASLIIVPNTLVDQWRGEVSKFLGKTPTVVAIKTQHALASLSIQDFQTADIIITTWQIFNNETYLHKLAHFTALPEMPSMSGRAFDAWYAYALARLAEHVEVLRNEGAEKLGSTLKMTFASTENDKELKANVPSKRLRGAAYRDAKARKDPTAKTATSSGTSSSKACLKRRHSQLLESSDERQERASSRISTDPFSLASQAVRKDWTQMRCPLFQMFHFNRLVVDEFTYVAGKNHTCITNLAANARWVLSGTPPLEDFADVKTIFVFLGINLGIDDDANGVIKLQTIKNLQKDRTAVEKFQASKQDRSPAWHERRHQVAQAFLDQFVRQNIAEIDEIPFQEYLRPVILPAAERAIYLELHSHLMSQDMKIRRGKSRADGDRVRRLVETLGTSKSAEEALLKRCSHFTLDDLKKNRENANETCEVVVAQRQLQLAELEADLRKNLRHAAWLKSHCKSDDKHYDGWKRNIASGSFGDRPAAKVLQDLIQTAEMNSRDSDEEEFYQPGSTTEKKPKPQAKATKTRAAKIKIKKLKRRKASRRRANDSEESDKASDTDGDEDAGDLRPVELVTLAQKVQALRDLAGHLRRLAIEFVSRRRSLRFFKIVRELQLAYSTLRRGEGSPSAFECSHCEARFFPSELVVQTLCGHIACKPCDPRRQDTGECSAEGCSARAKDFSIVEAAELGEEDMDARVGRHYGKKLLEVVHLIKREIPQDEQVLLFVQFDDLIEKVSQALTENGISNLALTEGNKRDSSSMMSRFQSETGSAKSKVLLLNVATESASGANLTNANHIIFLSPFLLHSQYHYDATTTQAIGRARRYGQKRTVHIYHFLSLKTIDVDILESRTRRKLVRMAGGFELRDEAAAEEQTEEKIYWGGGVLKENRL